MHHDTDFSLVEISIINFSKLLHPLNFCDICKFVFF